MAAPNTMRAYELLRNAIEQQRAQRQGDNWNSPSVVPEQIRNDDQAPKGLLGRLRALLAEQSEYQPIGGTDGSRSSQPFDPNVRQLSRAPIGPPPAAVGASKHSERQSGSTYFPASGDPSLDLGIGTVQGDAPPHARAGLFGTYSKTPAPSWDRQPVVMSPVPVGWRLGGVPFPLPGPPLSPPPRIPVPSIPEWWKVAGKLLQLYPTILSDRAAGGADDEECREQRRRAREICTEANANGWKSDYDVGPYSKPSGGTWSIDDCMRGLVSEACGGNPVDNEPRKDGKRKRGRR